MSDCEITPAVKAIFRQMAKTLVEAGHDNPMDIVDRIHAEVQDHTPVWKSEIADAISGYDGGGRKRTASELTTRMNQLKRDLKESFHPKDKNSTANKTRQTQLKKDIAELQRQLDTKDFSKPERTKPVYDEDTRKLEVERSKLKRVVDRTMNKLEYENSSRAAKTVDTAFAARRASLLSGLGVIFKLTGAAFARLVITPVEEGIQAGIRHIPYYSRISAKAPREGAGFTLNAEKEAFNKTFTVKTLKEMYNTAVKASGELDSMYGKDKYGMHKYLDIPGQIHGALKLPVKTNEFYRSVALRSDHAHKELIAQGKTPAEAEAIVGSAPGQAVITAQAFIDANKSIFMNDNKMVSAYKAFVGTVKNAKPGSAASVYGGAGARVLEFLLPIVKVPTNVVAEAGSYFAGGLKAAVQLAKAKGIEGLTPEQADYIVRNVKKQTLGAALMSIGYLAPQAFGGYYIGKSTYKDEEEPEEGSVKIGKLEIPKLLLHNPALEMLQMGATVRKVMDSLKDRVQVAEAAVKASPTKHNQEALDKVKSQIPLLSGVYEGAAGLLGEVPFLSTPKSLVSAGKSPAALAQFAQREIVGSAVPALSNDIAKWTDPEKSPRKARTLTDSLKLRVPYLREQVPTSDFNKIIGSTAKLKVFEELPTAERTQGNFNLLIEAINRSGSLTDDQKKAYLARANKAYNDAKGK